MKDGPVDIALVRMPYGETGQPSLALGLLKAVCDRHNLSSRVVPANLWFSEEVGPALHDLIFEAYSMTLIGEWTFAGVLFPDFEPDDTAYLRKAIWYLEMDGRQYWRHLHNRYPYLDAVELLRQVRRRAAPFVDRVVDHVLALEPKIVGCSSTFQQHCASLSLLRAIKQRRPGIITMIGGANCEADMGRVTFQQFPWLDYVVSGEADGFFGTMCETVLQARVDGIDPQDLPEGVWGPHHRRSRQTIRPDPVNSAVIPLRSIQRSHPAAGASVAVLPVAQLGEHVDGAPVARLEDMNDSPLPNYDDYFAYLAETEELGKWLRPALPYQTARGCWWGEKTHCSFCGISRTAMKFRAKSSDNVIEQIVALRERYGTSVFQGTEYIFDYRYFQTLLPRLKEFGGYFRFEVKANLKPEQLRAFVDSGTLEVQPGVESLHDHVLALLKKGVTARQNILLLKRARKVGLSVFWNMLHTIPGDRDEWYGEMADLVPRLAHLQPPYGCAEIHYDRFSPYWRNPASYGLELLPAYGYEYVYPFPTNVLNDLAYFFETPRQRVSAFRYSRVDHVGLLRLNRVLSAWKEQWQDRRQPPELTATDVGGRTEFRDTRPVATAPRFEIGGLEHRIYWAAEESIVPATLVKTLREENYTEEAIEAAIAQLVEKNVVVHLFGRLLALGITAPVPPFLAHGLPLSKAELNPVWARLMADEALDEKRPNIALSCVRMPDDQPLSAWFASGGSVAGAPAG